MSLKSTRCSIHEWNCCCSRPLNEQREKKTHRNMGNHFKLDIVQACHEFTQTHSSYTSASDISLKSKGHTCYTVSEPGVCKQDRWIDQRNHLNVCKVMQWSGEVRTKCCKANPLKNSGVQSCESGNILQQGHLLAEVHTNNKLRDRTTNSSKHTGITTIYAISAAVLGPVVTRGPNEEIIN